MEKNMETAIVYWGLYNVARSQPCNRLSLAAFWLPVYSVLGIREDVEGSGLQKSTYFKREHCTAP